MVDAPTLIGDRLVLRILEEADARAWQAGEDEEQRRWFEFPGPAPIENVVAAIQSWRASWAAGGPVHQWGIWAQNELAGGVEIRDRGDGRANVSYVVFPRYRRRGLAASALRLASNWALDQLAVDGVVAIIHPDNLASRRTVERAGFEFDGVAESWGYSESGPMVRYRLERTDQPTT